MKLQEFIPKGWDGTTFSSCLLGCRPDAIHKPIRKVGSCLAFAHLHQYGGWKPLLGKELGVICGQEL
eukprot:5401198-Amphidinium_carterae.1